MSEIVGERIKECRQRHELSMTELAEKTCLTISAISQFESGERAPSLESLNKLADAFQVSVDYLMGRDEEISDENIHAMFRGVQNMTGKDKEQMLHFYQFLKAKEKYKKGKGKEKDG